MPTTDAVQRFGMRLSFSDQIDKAVLLSERLGFIRADSAEIGNGGVRRMLMDKLATAMRRKEGLCDLRHIKTRIALGIAIWSGKAMIRGRST